MSEDTGSWSTIVRSEFAMVELSLEPCASGHALRIRDLVGQASVTLDAGELEGLCWLSPDDRAKLIDPTQRYEEGHVPSTRNE
jgi:hypothetical protein